MLALFGPFLAAFLVAAPAARPAAPLALVWLVGMTNSSSLLDNVDGLCAGSSAVAALSLALPAPTQAAVALPLAGAALVVRQSPWLALLPALAATAALIAMERGAPAGRGATAGRRAA